VSLQGSKRPKQETESALPGPAGYEPAGLIRLPHAGAHPSTGEADCNSACQCFRFVQHRHRRQTPVPYPFRTGTELLGFCRDEDLSVSQVMLANECSPSVRSQVCARYGRRRDRELLVGRRSPRRHLSADGVNLGCRSRLPRRGWHGMLDGGRCCMVTAGTP
jgi:hypothetical protein